LAVNRWGRVTPITTRSSAPGLKHKPTTSIEVHGPPLTAPAPVYINLGVLRFVLCIILPVEDPAPNWNPQRCWSLKLCTMSTLGYRGSSPGTNPFSKAASVSSSAPACGVLRPTGVSDRLPKGMLPDASRVNDKEEFCGKVIYPVFCQLCLLCFFSCGLLSMRNLVKMQVLCFYFKVVSNGW
jgi:hypothetical protein